MTTEAGRVYCPRCGHDWSEVAVVRNAARRARAALLAELEAGVEGLPIDYYGSDMSWDKAGVLRVNTIPARQMIDLAAVLDLIRKAGA